MECAQLLTKFNQGNRLIITQLKTIGGMVLDIIKYFDTLPRSWNSYYFSSAESFSHGLSKAVINESSVIVIPSDHGLSLGEVHVYAVKHNINILVIIGNKRQRIADKDRMYYM